MAKDLLIVESPAKAKTISKYLGSDFEVRASVGHIIDLPHNRLGVDIENNFLPDYVPIEGKKKVISELKSAAKGKGTIYLGPDPDREGEAIAWHIAQTLGDKYNFKRVLFHELTPTAIKAALANPVDLSQSRFESQQTRRILDRLMGYLISPILWEKLKRGLSAGRVQSVALRLVVEREKAIFAFNPEEYWSITALFTEEGIDFEAILNKFKDKKIELKNEEETQKVLTAISGQSFILDEMITRDRKRNPLPPFTTSTLQQAAFNRLKLNSSRTMKLAQTLYEGLELAEGSVGLITYMRSDSVRINETAALEAKDYIEHHLGASFVPKNPNVYSNKKGAQDAHEAIRPTSVDRTPEKIRGQIDPAHWQLYDLIWRRFVASQMAPALLEQTTLDLKCNDYSFRANGSVVRFKGFLAVYDPGQEDGKNILPPLLKDRVLNALSINPKQHFTQPPPRFNEATLVKELEEKGIGRPSTYAAIIATLRKKAYAEGAKGLLKPTEMGFAVNDLLVDNFPKLMDVDFTADLEENLDQIEEGQANQAAILSKLYLPLAESLSTARQNMINLRRDGVPVNTNCPACHKSDQIVIRYGRNGFYLSCACGSTTDYVRDEHGHPQPLENPEIKDVEPCELCGSEMVLKRGRFGPFLACSSYPACKNTLPLTSGETADSSPSTPPALPENFSTICEKCGGTLGPKRTRKGTWFISCSNYPKCKNAKPFPTNLKCPREGCDGDLVERISKRGTFFGCSNYPKCHLIIGGRPVQDKCPECGSPFMIQKISKDPETVIPLTCPNKNCVNYFDKKSKHTETATHVLGTNPDDKEKLIEPDSPKAAKRTAKTKNLEITGDETKISEEKAKKPAPKKTVAKKSNELLETRAKKVATVAPKQTPGSGTEANKVKKPKVESKKPSLKKSSPKAKTTNKNTEKSDT